MADTYDVQFRQYLALAKDLVVKLHTRGDRQICSKWIQKLCNLQSDDLSVKKNRNDFFKYLLQVIKDGVLEDSIRNQPTANSTLPDFNKSLMQGGVPKGGENEWLQKEVLDDKTTPYMSHWSQDRRTYVACKPLPGRGALIYMAVSKDPTLGWDVPGKRKPKSKSDG